MQDPLELDKQALLAVHCRCWEPNSGSQEEREGLLPTQPFLSPCTGFVAEKTKNMRLWTLVMLK